MFEARATRSTTPWIFRPKPNPAARLRLFCFPWAGVGAGVYRLWPGGLPSDVEVCAVRTPGRESRLREAPYTDLLALADAVGVAIRPFLDLPAALFGHSFGSWIAFEVARWLRREGHPPLVHLFVSGRRGPKAPPRDAPLHHLPDDEFLAEVQRRYGGIPEQIFEDRNLLALLLPALRADVTAVETYTYPAAEPLSCPVSAFAGVNDHWVLPQELEAWKGETAGPFRSQMFPGDHFFVESARDDLLRAIAARFHPATISAGR